ncbi:MAG: DUF1549 domain-containing protein [Planctomyces sp.]|nr:DUF1549 domain-containing protein [Planctomyces sp.]
MAFQGAFMPLRTLLVIGCLTAVVQGDDSAPEEPEISADERAHWAYLPLAGNSAPAVANPAWCRSPIDRFLLADLERRGLSPAGEAEAATLLRRATFDLTGLPPTPDELAAYLNDPAADRYERAVDRLLASPAYAERWAQHWLDVARYADTDGFEFDAPRPNAWRYRDWVVGAVGADMPYAEFVRLQIAGDLIAPDDPAALIATGFLLCGPDMPDINLAEERRHTFLNDLTSTVGQAFIGLQMGCAACHDHKFDPISQHDFYRLRAYFEPCELFREQPAPSLTEQAAVAEFEQRRADRWKEIEREKSRLTADDAEAHADAIAALAQELDALKKSPAPAITMARSVRQQPRTEPARFYTRGDFRRPGPEVPPAPPRIAVPPSPDLETLPPADRVELADWFADPENRLASRVIANRLWQHHFGRGLNDTENDFGFMGGSPAQPELLDWLARELHRQGGSWKALHRLIMTSSAYRLSSRPDGADDDGWRRLVENDPDNRRLGRRGLRRLDAESLRDAMLAVAGRLNDERGGPGVRPPLPTEVAGTLLRDQWEVTPGAGQHDRRSLYLFVRRNLRFPLFEAFDRPDTNFSCPRRYESITAPQALALLNSEFTWECAAGAAQRIRRESLGAQSRDHIDFACRLILGRPANDDDVATLAGEPDLTVVCAALLNSSEFLYVD